MSDDNELQDITGPLYQQYESLILQRDQLKKEAGSIWTAYLKIFGQLLTESFRLQVDCIRKKKEISFIMRAINSGSVLNMDEMKEQIETEMTLFQQSLDDLMEDARDSLVARISDADTVRKVRQLYRSIAKQIHPDIYPEAMQNETIRDLWARAEEAYAANDLKALTEISVLVQKVLHGGSIPAADLSSRELQQKISDLKEEIHTIRTTDPYCLGALLENPEETSRKEEELKQEIEDYQKYFEELSNTADQLLAQPGLRIVWSYRQ